MSTEERRARQRAQWATPEKKAQRKEYLSRPEVRARLSGYHKKYRATEKGKRVASAASRRCALKKLYGLSEQEYERKFRTQDGACALCGGQNLDGRRLFVDHDHKTGKVRDLLCHKCNGLLGHASDNILLLYKAADYLERHARKVLTKL